MMPADIFKFMIRSFFTLCKLLYWFGHRLFYVSVIGGRRTKSWLRFVTIYGELLNDVFVYCARFFIIIFILSYSHMKHTYQKKYLIVFLRPTGSGASICTLSDIYRSEGSLNFIWSNLYSGVLRLMPTICTPSYRVCMHA